MRLEKALGERVLEVLTDPESRSIVNATLVPKTVLTLEVELRMNRSTLYRKLHHLKECGLVMVDSYILKDDGKKEAMLTRTFAEVRAVAEDHEMRIELVESERALEKRWFELFFSRRVEGHEHQPVV